MRAHTAPQHRKDGLARRCTAWDLFLVAGGLQCGNCGVFFPSLSENIKDEAELKKAEVRS